tara:strand:+ start:1571 stop:1831 length:261 start_codon:yes stop_codon:yes gene_type:complete
MDDLNSQSNLDLINLSQAARFLGYQSTNPIKKLISQKKILSYKLPDSKRIMINCFELESLIEPYIPEKVELINSENPSKPLSSGKS